MKKILEIGAAIAIVGWTAYWLHHALLVTSGFLLDWARLWPGIGATIMIVVNFLHERPLFYTGRRSQVLMVTPESVAGFLLLILGLLGVVFSIQTARNHEIWFAYFVFFAAAAIGGVGMWLVNRNLMGKSILD